MEELAENTKTGAEGLLPVTPRLDDEIITIKGRRANFFDSRFVFSFKNVYNAFTGACKQAKIDNLRFRDWRSTGAEDARRHRPDDCDKGRAAYERKILREHYTNIDIENARLIASGLSDFNEFSLSKVKTKVNDVLGQSAVAG